MFSMFGRTGTPTKMGPHMRTKKISATCQHNEIACANIIINGLFNNSSTKSSTVALLEPKLILITITINDITSERLVTKIQTMPDRHFF